MRRCGTVGGGVCEDSIYYTTYTNKPVFQKKSSNFTIYLARNFYIFFTSYEENNPWKNAGTFPLLMSGVYK